MPRPQISSGKSEVCFRRMTRDGGNSYHVTSFPTEMPEKMANNSPCFKFNFALVSRIANSFRDSSSFDLKGHSPIDIDKARKEHEELVETLRRIGVDVIELPCDEKHPDGLFVDDIAVVINGTALICNPPTIKDRPSRQGEVWFMYSNNCKKNIGSRSRPDSTVQKDLLTEADIRSRFLN